MKCIRFGLAILTGLGLAASVPAFAQYQPLMNPLVRTTIPQVIQCPGCNKARQKTAGDNQVTSPVPTAVAASADTLRFTPNLATRKRNLAGFVAKTQAQSPENADQLAQMFASTDIFAAMEEGLAPMGLRTDNVADAYTVYWITAWEASRGIIGKDTPRAQAQAVKSQASRALLTAPEFARATPAQKQEFSEGLLLQAMLISASIQSVADDPAQRKAVGSAVLKGAKAMGLDLDAMELSEAGFGPAK